MQRALTMWRTRRKSKLSKNKVLKPKPDLEQPLQATIALNGWMHNDANPACWHSAAACTSHRSAVHAAEVTNDFGMQLTYTSPM